MFRLDVHMYYIIPDSTIFLILHLCNHLLYAFLCSMCLQSVELTSEAEEFLKGIFSTFDEDKVCLSRYFFTSSFRMCILLH